MIYVKFMQCLLDNGNESARERQAASLIKCHFDYGNFQTHINLLQPLGDTLLQSYYIQHLPILLKGDEPKTKSLQNTHKFPALVEGY